VANPDQDSDVPHQFPNVPPDMSLGAGHIRLVINALEGSIHEIKGDVRDIKKQLHSDFVVTMYVFATGFILLAGMLIFGYFRLDDKIEGKMKDIDNRVDTMVITTTKIDTKLDDLLQRIPPTQTPIPGTIKK
jgi:hypothetical protein